MAIKCGHCTSYHETVAAVRACSELVSVKLSPAVEAVGYDIPAKPARVTSDGLFILNGDAVKVVWNQTNTRIYGKSLQNGRWVRDSSVLRRLDESMRMTAEQGSAFGKLYGCCVNCSKVLTNEISIYFGYGETCAGNLGWPWYDCPEAHVTGE